MSWDEHLLSNRELAPYLRDRNPAGLLDRVNGLLNHQQANWPLLARGIQSLSQIELKKLPIGRFTLLVQHNPQRIISTTAQVDRKSVERRACFLCADNLPPEEKGVAFDQDFIILCNPYPIVDRHLSIVHRQHLPQTIVGHFETVLGLAEELSPDYFVLYNGPRCGASAPDHLHFQAGSRAMLPIEEHLKANKKASMADQILKSSQEEVFWIPQYHIPILVYRGSNQRLLNEWFNQTVDLLAQLTNSKEEPMLNLIAFADAAKSHQPNGANSTLRTVIVFPRSKHRPACFFADGEQKLTISPAAVDLAGLLVIPVKEHFDRLTSSDARQVLSEVSLDGKLFSQLLRGLRDTLSGGI